VLNQSLSHSVTHSAYLMPREPKLAFRNISPNESSIVLTQKRHLLARKHVVGATKCKNRSNGSTWARAGEKMTGQKNSQNKSQKCYI